MPGNATCDIASAARAIRRITAKQPTRPAAIAIVIESKKVLKVMDVIVEGRSIDFREQIGREDLPRRPKARVFMPEAQHVRRVLINDRKVVRDEKHRDALFFLKMTHYLIQLLLTWLIHTCRGFIEQQDGRIAQERE